MSLESHRDLESTAGSRLKVDTAGTAELGMIFDNEGIKIIEPTQNRIVICRRDCLRIEEITTVVEFDLFRVRKL